MQPSAGTDRVRVAVAGLLVGVGALMSAVLMPQPAQANVPFEQISSGGPIEEIWLGDELSCQVKLDLDEVFSFFPEGFRPGDCGTLLAVGGTVYGPDFANHDLSAAEGFGFTPFTPNSQSAVSGNGSAGDPYVVTTRVDAGTTGIGITERTSYVAGETSYSSRVLIANSNPGAQSVTLYRAGDCFHAGSDSGFGWVDGGGAFCAENANNSPAGRTIGFRPISGPPSHFFEASFGQIWSALDGSPLPDLCRCDEFIDNGAALSWDVTVPGDSEVVVETATTIDPGSGPEPGPEPAPPAEPPLDGGPPPEDGPPGEPVVGKSVNVKPVEGTVRTKCKGDQGFSELEGEEQIAVGCLVDTRRGTVLLISSKGTAGGTQSGEFWDGLFRVKQKAEKKAETVLALAGPLGCKKKGRIGSFARGKKGGRGLWGDGDGKHTTKGDRGAGSSRGTKWFVGDRCNRTTFVKVKQGVVSFRDFVDKKTVIVRAGESYSTEPGSGGR